MFLVNEKVEHKSYGLGVISEENGNKISIQFQGEVGNKTFVYPDAFEKFLKLVDPKLESLVQEELQTKQEQIKLEFLEKEREAAELEEKSVKPIPTKKRATRTVKKKI